MVHTYASSTGLSLWMTRSRIPVVDKGRWLPRTPPDWRRHANFPLKQRFVNDVWRGS